MNGVIINKPKSLHAQELQSGQKRYAWKVAMPSLTSGQSDDGRR